MNNDEKIEVLDEDLEMIEVDDTQNEESSDDFTQADENSVNNENNFISIDTLFETESIKNNEKEEKEKNIKKQNKITKIQIGLIIFLIVSASLIYFFGYDIFEPFIKID